jgi:hypothetical protein
VFTLRASKLSPHQTHVLLDELCIDLGFCLPPKDIARLESNPPTDINAFATAVIRAEGLDPDRDVPLHLRRDIKARIAKHFKRAEGEILQERILDDAI